jgi:hypothetical protein
MLKTYDRLLVPTRLIVLLLSILFWTGVNAETIDLECEALTQTFIKQLSENGILDANMEKQNRARQLALDLCVTTTKFAQDQHELDKQQALENWFFEYHPEKPGNRRLKKTH